MANPTQANVVTSTDTFNDWVLKTNQIATAIANVVVTANSTLGVTSGNGYVNGIFSANTLVAVTNIRGGNNSVSNTLIISSNFSTNTSTFSAGQVVLSNTATNQIVDSFAASTYRSAKYLLQIATASGYQSTEIMLLQDGTNVFITEYATLANNGSMGVFSANMAAGTINLLVSPTQVSSTVNFQRTTLSV